MQCIWKNKLYTETKLCYTWVPNSLGFALTFYF